MFKVNIHQGKSDVYMEVEEENKLSLVITFTPEEALALTGELVNKSLALLQSKLNPLTTPLPEKTTEEETVEEEVNEETPVAEEVEPEEVTEESPFDEEEDEEELPPPPPKKNKKKHKIQEVG